MQRNPLFTGEHIYLRPFQPDDLPTLRETLNHAQLVGRRYLPWGFPDELPLSEKQIEQIYDKWLEKEKGICMGVVPKESEAVVGYLDCSWGWDTHSPNLSVVIHPEEQRQGYGGEALGLMLRYLFEHTPAHNISTWVADWNDDGRGFAAKNGYRESGAIRRAGIRGGIYYTTVLVDILRPEWEARRGGESHGA